jgi:hypothetical protein
MLNGSNFTGSEKNASLLTLDGVDVMGERLADEVNFYIQIMINLYNQTIS